MARKTALAVALLSAAPAPVTSAVVRVDTRDILTDVECAKRDNEQGFMDMRTAMEAYIAPQCVDALEDLAAAILAHCTELDTFQAFADECVRRAFPVPCDWDAWKEIAAQFKHGVFGTKPGKKETQYPYRCLIRAYKAVHLELPTAGTGAGGGRTGNVTVSPGRWYKGMVIAMEGIAERVAKMPDDVTPGRAATVAKLLAELNAEIGAIGRKIANAA